MDMSHLHTIDPAEASGAAREMFEQIERRLGHVPNWARPFSLRPGVRDGWVALLSSITAQLPVRTYELATLAAARALRSTYCSLAHGSFLAARVFDAEAVTAIATGEADGPLEPRERAMMGFAAKVALHADRVTRDDVDDLRAHGWADAEIFDIAAAAAARCFFAKLLDGLGVQADASYAEIDPKLRAVLVVGRPLAAPG
jgi:uncharacterized peroxidase-related enzyme